MSRFASDFPLVAISLATAKDTFESEVLLKWLDWVGRGRAPYADTPEYLRGDRDLLYAALRKGRDRPVLRHADPELRNNREVGAPKCLSLRFRCCASGTPYMGVDQYSWLQNDHGNLCHVVKVISFFSAVVTPCLSDLLINPHFRPAISRGHVQGGVLPSSRGATQGFQVQLVRKRS